nr:hypothetical protein [Tanacetum cinerariifolium]
MRTPVRRVILFGTIPTTIPDTALSVTSPTTHIDTTLIPTVSSTITPSPDYTPASPDYLLASDTEFNPSEDPSSYHIPPLLAASPFLSSTDDSSGIDIPDTPPSPTHGQPIPHGRPYRYHPNGSIHMVTARKRVEPMPTHRLAMRHSVYYSSSNHFSLDDLSMSSSSSSSSETSSDSSTDALSDSASSRSSSDHSLPASSLGVRPSHHLCSLRSRSPAASVPLSSPIPRSLTYTCDDLLPSPKRNRSPESATDLEDCLEDSFKPYVPREVGLGVDFKDKSTEPSRSRGTGLKIDVDVERSNGIEIDPEIQVEIDECIAYVDALRDRGIDARVVVEAIDREEIETGMSGLVKVRVDRVTHPMVADDIHEPAQEGAVEVTYETLGDLVQRFHDHTEEILVHRVQAIKGIQKDQGHRIIATGQQSANMLERIQELERDNRRLRDMMDVESQIVARFRRRELRVQRELRQIRVIEQSDCQMAEALRAREVVRNLGPLMRDGGEQEEVSRNRGNGNGGNRNEENGNGGNGNGGDGNGNGNGGGYGYNFRGFIPARECTYQDFLKCQPLNFNGMEGVVGFTRCALTWWNSHKRTIRIEAAYTMSWLELMKLMTEVYYPINEVQKMETELWNLVVKGNDLIAYTRKFQELVLLCT